MTTLPFVPDSDPLVVPTKVAATNGASLTPQTTTLTLPRNGIYLVAVSCRLNGAPDHMMTGLFLVQYYDAGANDTLLSTQLGATSKAAASGFGLNTLTLSNPTSGGVVTATATWTSGGTYAAYFELAARLLTAL